MLLILSTLHMCGGMRAEVEAAVDAQKAQLEAVAAADVRVDVHGAYVPMPN